MDRIDELGIVLDLIGLGTVLVVIGMGMVFASLHKEIYIIEKESCDEACRKPKE